MTNVNPVTFETASFDALTKAGLSAAESYLKSLGDLARLFMSANPVLQTMQASQRNCCDIPPACWLPRPLGEITSFVCAGGTASLRIRVTNCQPRSSHIEVSFAEAGSQTKVVPPAATLGPMERKSFNAFYNAPADAAKGHRVETLLWVRGCNAYYLRWIVEVRDNASGSCGHEIVVDDCADYVHHWYDHFYCNRPCSQSK
jgi:hypothetical protein